MNLITHPQDVPAGIDEARTAQALLRSLVDRSRAPGLQWAVGGPARPEIVLWAGLADTCTGYPVGPETVFLSSSTTKFITALLVLQMVDRGMLSLATPLSDVLPDIPYRAPVTVGMALAHTGGLPNPNPMRWVHDPGTTGAFDEQRALDAVLARSPRLLSEPGTRYRYSNVGYWLLGRLLERLSGQNYGDLVRDRIAGPLELDPLDLGCTFPPGDLGARGHVRKRSLVYPFLRVALPRQLDGCRGGPWGRLAKLSMDGLAYGGIFARTRGYLAVLQDLLCNPPTLLSAASRDRLLRPQALDLETCRSTAFGLNVGTHRGHLFLSKPGGGPGFSSNLRIYPDIGLASVWMRNCLSFSEREIERFSDLLDSVFL